MTLLVSAAPSRSASPSRAAGWPRVAGWRVLLLLLLVAGAFGGAAVGAAIRPVVVPEPNLVLLLRFMAALKGSAVLGAAVLALWRLRRPVETSSALGYGAGLALMAVAPGLVWSLAHVAAGAACFHAGLFVFAISALRDDAMAPALLRRARQQRPGAGRG